VGADTELVLARELALDGLCQPVADAHHGEPADHQVVAHLHHVTGGHTFMRMHILGVCTTAHGPPPHPRRRCRPHRTHPPPGAPWPCSAPPSSWSCSTRRS